MGDDEAVATQPAPLKAIVCAECAECAECAICLQAHQVRRAVVHVAGGRAAAVPAVLMLSIPPIHHQLVHTARALCWPA